AKSLGEKTGLAEHALRSTIVIGISRQRFVEKLLEAADVPRLAAKLIIEPEHFGQQSRSQQSVETERRHTFSGRRLHDDVAVVRSQTMGWAIEPGMKLVIKPVTRREDRRPVAPQGPRQLTGRAFSWDEDDTREQPLGI